MEDLIKALQILAKYETPTYPTGCDDDTLYIYVNPASVPDEDIAALEALHVFPSPYNDCFYSYRYGRA